MGRAIGLKIRPVRVRIPLGAPHARLAQLAEAIDLGSIQYGFDSLDEYHHQKRE